MPLPRPDIKRIMAAYAALDAAALLRGLGCQVLGCHAINSQPCLKVRAARRLDVARLTSHNVIIEWSVKQ